MRKVSPPTLRGKLLVWFISTITITFFILGGLVSMVIWQVLHDQIDHHLHTVIVEAEQVLASNPVSNRNDFLRTTALQQGMTVAIIGPDGTPVLQTNSPEIARLSEDVLKKLLQDSPSNSMGPVHFNVNEIRFATLPVSLPEGKGLLAIGYSLSVVEQTFQKLLGIIVLTLVIMLAATAYGIQTLLSRYLKPVELIATKTNEITQSRLLSLRVEESGETIEVQSLTKSINNMLDRLEGFFKTEQEFFSNAAHTLKTPLAIVRSYIESSAETKDKTKTLSVIDQANETIQDLLLISRMNTQEQIDLKEISLSKMLEELLEIITVLADEKGIRVHAHIEPNIIVNAHPQLLKRAFSNLLHNAINYTPKGGNITLELEQQLENIVVRIQDTGVGIPAKERNRVFDRFYRGSNVSKIKGNGLGLPIVKAIVEALGGTIQLESRLGHGTKVAITLPFI